MTQTSDYDVEVTRVLGAPPDRVYQAFTDADQFVSWYGPVGFPVDRATVELDARVGGRQRFVMVSDDDPSMRTGFNGRFIEVVENELLASEGAWEGFPVSPEIGPRVFGLSSTTRMARPAFGCARTRTRPQLRTWDGKRGK